MDDWDLRTPPPPEDYVFLFEEMEYGPNGWWYKIDTAERLVDYHIKTSSRFSDAIDDYWRCNVDKETGEFKPEGYDELGEPMAHPYKQLTRAIVMFGEHNNLNIIDAAKMFRLMIADQQLKAIHKHGYIVVNPAGGYHSGPIKYSQWVRRDKYLYPDYKESDIRIKQFPNGTHYYVHIDDMELHEGEDIKWNSYDEAYAAARRYVHG